MAQNVEERWEVLEVIGAYAAGELEGEEAREAEQLLLRSPDHQRLAESYARMLVVLAALGEENVEAPEAIISYAVRRAYVSAFMRQAEGLARGIVGDYVGALVAYLRLRPTEDGS